jgi:hypothetical protein
MGIPCLAPHPDDQPPVQRLCRRGRHHKGNHRDIADGAIERHGKTAEWPNLEYPAEAAS